MLPVNEIILGDCLQVMRGWPDKCVDLIVTDPPYGIGLDYGNGTVDNLTLVKHIASKIVPEMIRVARLVIITPGVVAQYEYPKPNWCLCWHYRSYDSRCQFGFNQWQPILAYGNDPILAYGFGGRPDTIVHLESSQKNGHPCPKPIGFISKLIARFTINDFPRLILDPFCGSGTTLVAAKQLGRRYIGIEIEPKYVAICKERLKQEQLPL